MKIGLRLTVLCVLVLGLVGGTAASAPPPAPTPLAPANGGQVLVPFTISWSQVLDPTAINGGYNWEVSPVSDFSRLVQRDSTFPSVTQATVSGLVNGTYFWRVQAVNAALEQGAWSPTRSFSVTGVGPGQPGTPTLNQPKGGTQFHPLENITWTWSAVPDAASYVAEWSTDSRFPVGTSAYFSLNNIPGTTDGMAFGDTLQGAWFMRVRAVNADGVAGLPSNAISFSVLYSNPVGPPPTPLVPADGATVTLPVTLTWTDGYNPQDLGYELEISTDPSFTPTQFETFFRQTNPTRTVPSLTPGTKFWRVRSRQGDSSPTTAAVTAWSPVRSFTVSSAPPTVASFTLTRNPLYSGAEQRGQVQLTGVAPAGGAVVSLTSSDPNALPVPATVTVEAGFALGPEFILHAGQVATPSTVTVTATYGGSSASSTITVLPPTLKQLVLPLRITGGTTGAAGAMVLLEGNGFAGVGGVVVSLASDSPLASPPATVTIPEGSNAFPFIVPTSAVTAATTVTITASYKGVTVQSKMTLAPQEPPASLTLDRTSTTGNEGATGTVARSSAPSGEDIQFSLSSSNPAVARVPSYVTVGGFAAAGGFLIQTTPPTSPTEVTISVSGAGVTKSVTLMVNPFPPPTPAAPSLVSPAADATPAQPVTFDWNDVANATSYEIQVDSSSTIAAPFTASQIVSASQATIGGLPAQRLWWRVRARNSAGVFGPFSATRRFTPQAAPSAPSLSSLSLSPTSVVGGNSATGTVTLTSAAPSGGTPVTLSSASSAIASVPASVTIAAGATSASFPVTTGAVAASTAVTLTTAWNGVTRTATLTVTPPPPPASLNSLSLSPASITGGSSSQGTVTLTSAAPNGGLVVALSSSNAVAGVPASVTVAAGATSAAFAATTSSVSVPTAVTITATSAGVNRSTTLTVNPVSSGSPPAPSLLSPANDARFSPGQTISFDWSDVSGAASYTLQIDDSDTFPSPIVNQMITPSSFATSTLPATRMWWRIRASDAAGNPGAWSSVRRFEVK